MRSIPGRCVVVCCLVSSSLTEPIAQQPTFRSKVDLVQVDVVAVDREGNPVRGLQLKDFELFDRKKPQTIAMFEEVSHERSPTSGLTLPPTVRSDVASNQAVQSNRLVVIVVDDLHIYRGRTDRAKEIARKVLIDLGREASMAVLFTSGKHSTQVTDDRSILMAAVETLQGRQAVRRPHQAIDAQSPGRIGPEMSSAQALAAIQKSQNTSLQDFFENMAHYNTLRDAARMMGAGDSRRKAFVLISEGIGKQLSGLFGAMSVAADVPSGGLEYAMTGDPAATTVVEPNGYHDHALIDMMDAMRRSNVATYAIDPRGRISADQLPIEAFPDVRGMGADPASRSFGDPAADNFRWSNPIRWAQDGLRIMAAASGGFAVTDTDDFTSGLNQIISDLDHYYLLGFYPEDSKGSGYRPIEVKVNRSGVILRFRHGYRTGGPPTPPKNSDPLATLSAGILPKSDLPLRLTAVPLRNDSGQKSARVLIALEVTTPRRELEEPDGRLQDDLKYVVLVVDEKRSKVRSAIGLHGRLTLSPNASRQQAPDTVTYQVSESITLMPGRYQIRVSAHSAKLGKGGSVYQEIEVPDYTSTPLAISGLVLGYAEGARVPIAPPMTGRTNRPKTPATTGSAVFPFPPSLNRQFKSTDTLRLYFEAQVGETPSQLTATVDVLDASSHIVKSVPASLTEGRGDLHLTLAELPQGAYVLRVAVSNQTHAVARELGFVVW